MKPARMSKTVTNYLVQSAAAAAWFDDETDRLHRSGAKRAAFDMWEITTEQLDKLILEALEKKKETLEKKK